MDVVDAFHVAEYLQKAAEAISGVGTSEARIQSATWRETVKAAGGPKARAIAEAMGRSSELNLAHQTLHYNDENGKHQYDSKGIPTAFDTTADYHTYGYLWAADWVCWHIDSVESRCLTKGVPTSAAYVILNLGLPDWFGMPDSTTPFPASMDVDWVRVYAQP